MKKLHSILLIGFLYLAFMPQQKSLLKTISGKFDFFTTDNLGNIYAVNGDELQKYTNEYEFQYAFSSKILGNISGVDFNFPLKPILYYQDLRQIVLLDNTLSIQGSPVELENFDLEQANVACASINNSYWFFDQLEFTLLRLDANFDILQKTENINQQIGISLQPNFMVEHQDWLYINDPETGILVFDLFGTYSKTIPIKGLNHFQCVGENIVYSQEQNVWGYNTRNFEIKMLHHLDSSLLQARAEKEKLYLLDSLGIKVFSMK